MVTRFLLGPAGSGKTYRCLEEIRSALASAPDGTPLVLLAPKQSTYQLERALLAQGGLPGYTRLHVLSFERLAQMAYERLGVPMPRMLSEQGRLMVLRSILSQRKDDLRLFRSSARLTGFADQLAMVLDELQRHEVTPDQLDAAAEGLESESLALKLRDISTLYRDYTAWLQAHQLRDANLLLTSASSALRKAEDGPPLFAGLWADGFADLSVQEAAFLSRIAKRCENTTVTFCLRQPSEAGMFWLSNWAAPGKSMERCRKLFLDAGLPPPAIERIAGDCPGRFSSNPAFAHIEQLWAAPRPWAGDELEPARRLRIASCPDPETEVREAAREIVRHVRAGGRFREVAVLARRLDAYHSFVKRVFRQFDIPVFIDRREDVSHHPVAELTRSALRTIVFDWRPEDWFTALKTGLVPARDEEVDRLENEALARGWKGESWRGDLKIAGDEVASAWLAELVGRLMPPFSRLHAALRKNAQGPTGRDVVSAIRMLWDKLKVEDKLKKWAELRSEGEISGESHLTVWSQVNTWLDDVELAFAAERLSLREWMPILEAGLSKLTVGVIPPALDQVLAGEIDRSRNCEARHVILLGLNESMFPAGRQQSALLTESDRMTLDQLEIAPAGTARDQMARERHLGYLAFTRASERLALFCSGHDSQGAITNPSPFLSQFRQLFPSLEVESVPASRGWMEAEHPHETILPILSGLGKKPEAQAPAAAARRAKAPSLLFNLEPVQKVLAVVGTLSEKREAALDPALALKLYGPMLKTSVSRMEQFAACPFRFFVNSGLDAKERDRFELDAREKGSFQHVVLSEFHSSLSAQGKRWRDITPAEARNLVAQIASDKATHYRDGLLQTTEQTQFTALLLTEALQDFTETMVEWMRSQYLFDPVAAEMDFGQEAGCPPWDLSLGSGLTLRLHGRIDRVDLYRKSESGDALCVVIDYKSGQKKLEDVSIHHGLQLQLLSYLNVLARWPDARKTLGVAKLIPAGVFYVSLRGDSQRSTNRTEALQGIAESRKAAYKHSGRFDAAYLRLLDSREDAKSGDQFSYRLKNDGTISKNCIEALNSGDFAALLAKVESNLVEMGARILRGDIGIEPCRKGSQTVCRHCDYASICRTDPWTQVFRVLKIAEEDAS